MPGIKVIASKFPEAFLRHNLKPKLQFSEAVCHVKRTPESMGVAAKPTSITLECEYLSMQNLRLGVSSVACAKMKNGGF
jgi:hypothetical protein